MRHALVSGAALGLALGCAPALTSTQQTQLAAFDACSRAAGPARATARDVIVDVMRDGFTFAEAVQVAHLNARLNTGQVVQFTSRRQAEAASRWARPRPSPPVANAQLPATDMFHMAPVFPSLLTCLEHQHGVAGLR